MGSLTNSFGQFLDPTVIAHNCDKVLIAEEWPCKNFIEALIVVSSYLKLSFSGGVLDRESVVRERRYRH